MDIWWLVSWANHRRAPRSASSDRVDQQSERHFAGQGRLGGGRGAPPWQTRLQPARRDGRVRSPRGRHAYRVDRGTPPRRSSEWPQRRCHRIRCDAGKLAIVGIRQRPSGSAPVLSRPRNVGHHAQRDVRSGRQLRHPRRRGGSAGAAPWALRSAADDRRRQLRHRFARPAHGSFTGQTRVGRRRAPTWHDSAITSMLRPVHHGQRGRVATFRG